MTPCTHLGWARRFRVWRMPHMCARCGNEGGEAPLDSFGFEILKRRCERAILGLFLSASIALQELFGALRELATHFASFAFDALDTHVVIGGGLVSHPSDHCGRRPFLDGDALRTCDGAAPDGCGVVGDGLREPLRFFLIAGVEAQELTYRGGEIFYVLA